MRPRTGCDQKMGIQLKTVLRGARLRLCLAFITAITVLPINLSSQESIDGKLFSGLRAGPDE
jgi:hypothetical protein